MQYFTESLLGFKEKKSAILEQRNSLLKMLFIINIPNIVILYLFNLKVPEPYMDETFHYNQFLAYADGHYQVWDPKITTPPGLYWIQKALSVVLGTNLSTLRAINSLLFANLFAIFVMKIYEFQDRNTNNVSRALNVILTPSIYFFSFLDYTDTPSLAFITMAYYYSIVNSQYRLAICSLLAVYTRQNNIVWVAYLVMHRIFTDYSKSINLPRTFSHHLLNVFKVILHNKKAILKQVKLELLVFVIFLGYLYKFNDGHLVFGDRQNHVPMFHPTQILYLSLFIALNAPTTITQYWNSITSSLYAFYYSRHALASYLFILSICIVIVDKWTIVHPFILSDNRHFVFYIYRYFFKNQFIRFALCLLYPLCIIFMVKTVVHSPGKMAKIILWFFASFIYLSTTGLVEVRYFSIPYLMYSLEIRNREVGVDIQKIHRHIQNSGKGDRMIWLTLLKVLGNAILIAIFLFWTFDGGNSRFMW